MEASKRHEMKTVPELSNELGTGLKIRHNFRGDQYKGKLPVLSQDDFHDLFFI